MACLFVVITTAIGKRFALDIALRGCIHDKTHSGEPQQFTRCVACMREYAVWMGYTHITRVVVKRGCAVIVHHTGVAAVDAVHAEIML
jgi:hypothetical protein